MLIGESKAASWRTQTPLATTASTEHPTEQWLQTVCLISVLTGASATGSVPSSPMYTEKRTSAFSVAAWIASSSAISSSREKGGVVAV